MPLLWAGLGESRYLTFLLGGHGRPARDLHWRTGKLPVPLLWTGLGKSRSMPVAVLHGVLAAGERFVDFRVAKAGRAGLFSARRKAKSLIV